MNGKMTTLKCATLLGLAPIEKTNPLAHQPMARTDWPQNDADQWAFAPAEAKRTHEERMDAILKLRNAGNREKEA